MRVGLVGVQHHGVAVVGELGFGERARRLVHGRCAGARRHRQHEVEGLASVAFFGDARAAHAPLFDDVAQGVLAFAGDATVIFHGQPAGLADVAQVGGNGTHAAPAAGDFDHHLGCVVDDGGAQALPKLGRTGVNGRARQRRCAAGHSAVRSVEQPVAPLDEDAVDGVQRLRVGLFWHGCSPSLVCDECRRAVEVAADVGVHAVNALSVGFDLCGLGTHQQAHEGVEVGRDRGELIGRCQQGQAVGGAMRGG